MKHLFVPYELALKLKEKGFDEECFARYNGGEFQLTKHQNWNLYPNVYRLDVPNTKVGLIKSGTPVIISAPLYQQVVDWLMTEHDLYPSTWFTNGGWSYNVTKLQEHGNRTEPDWHEDHYEALRLSIEEALKLIS